MVNQRVNGWNKHMSHLPLKGIPNGVINGLGGCELWSQDDQIDPQRGGEVPTFVFSSSRVEMPEKKVETGTDSAAHLGFLD